MENVEHIKLLDLADPKRIKETVNTLIDLHNQVNVDVRDIATTAAITANRAKTTADTANGTATEALAKSNSALQQSEDALQNSEDALQKSETASSNAYTARIAAGNADTKASSAVQNSLDAQNTAIEALRRASSADTTATAADEKASQALAATADYNALNNKPKINGIELVGNKTFEELGLEIDMEGLATEEYVNAKVAELVNSAPDELNTLGELALAFQNNKNVLDTLNDAITKKANKADLGTAAAKDTTDTVDNSTNLPTANAVLQYVQSQLANTDVSTIKELSESSIYIHTLENGIYTLKPDVNALYYLYYTDSSRVNQYSLQYGGGILFVSTCEAELFGSSSTYTATVKDYVFFPHDSSILYYGYASADKGHVNTFTFSNNYIYNTVNNLTNYYKKSETYTKAEVEQYVSENSGNGNIDTISVNGVEQTINNKNVDLDVVESEEAIETDGVTNPLDAYYPKTYVEENFIRKDALLDYVHPILSYYESDDPTDPGILFGGVWEKVEGVFMLSSNSNYLAGTQGGDTTHYHTFKTRMGWYYGSSGGEKVGLAYNAQTDSWDAVTLGDGFDVGLNNGVESASKSVGTYNGEISTGTTTSDTNMPPYRATNRWQRIA